MIQGWREDTVMIQGWREDTVMIQGWRGCDTSPVLGVVFVLWLCTLYNSCTVAIMFRGGGVYMWEGMRVFENKNRQSKFIPTGISWLPFFYR